MQCPAHGKQEKNNIRLANVWNSLPVDTDFSSLTCFIRQINRLEFSGVSLYDLVSTGSYNSNFCCFTVPPYWLGTMFYICYICYAGQINDDYYLGVSVLLNNITFLLSSNICTIIFVALFQLILWAMCSISALPRLSLLVALFDLFLTTRVTWAFAQFFYHFSYFILFCSIWMKVKVKVSALDRPGGLRALAEMLQVPAGGDVWLGAAGALKTAKITSLSNEFE